MSQPLSTGSPIAALTQTVWACVLLLRRYGGYNQMRRLVCDVAVTENFVGRENVA